MSFLEAPARPAPGGLRGCGPPIRARLRSMIFFLRFRRDVLYARSRFAGCKFRGREPFAGVAELVDALDLGSSDESHGGSSPSARTTDASTVDARPGMGQAADSRIRDGTLCR